ncbi:protein serine/threonine phosphatase, partial [Vibrio harveyi]
RVFSLFVGWG